MTKIKICGLTREEDALLCRDLGADFLGFVFVETSPRYVSPERAASIAAAVSAARERAGAAGDIRPPKLVGVFRDASAAYVNAVVEAVPLELVQLHGGESDEDVSSITVPAIKALRIAEALPETSAHPSAEWLLFDTLDERRTGGTGRRFDWSLLAHYDRAKPFFLAGGLTPDNVAVAISSVRPDGIDLSSGVELEPGIKDAEKLRMLFERVGRP